MPLHHWNVDDKLSLRDSLYGLDSYVSHLLYERNYFPGDVVLAGATHTVINSKVLVIKFATGVDTYCYMNMVHPAYWVDGNLHITVFYSGDITSGGMVVEGAVTAVGENDNLSSSSQASVNATASAPSNANELESVLIQPFSVDANDDTIGIRIGRLGTNGSDTNAGDLYISSVNVKYYPERI